MPEGGHCVTAVPVFFNLMSMKKILLFLSFLLVSIGMWSAETIVYTLDGTITGGSNGYVTVSDITQDGILWKVTGNTTMNPWRIGGKNITNTDRPIYCTSSISADVSKIIITTGTKTLSSVNSITLIVSTSQDGSGTIISTETKTAELVNTSLTFSKPSDKSWTNRYYKIVFNVSAGGSNQYIQFISACFYEKDEPITPCDSVTATLFTSHGSASLNKTKICKEESIEVTNIVPDEGYELDTIACVDKNGENVGIINQETHIISDIDDSCYVYVIFKEIPPEPTIDVVEWNPDYIKVDIDNYDAVSAIIQNQNTQLNVENFADSLFFSKYFEAASSVKLLGVYNGTNHSIDISSYGISVATCGDDKLPGSFSTKLFSEFVYRDVNDYDNTLSLTAEEMILKPNEEIIFISYQKGNVSDSAIIKCAKENSSSGFEKYYRLKTPELQFNGDDAVALVNPDGNFIDLIGAGTKAGGSVVSGVDRTTTNTGTYNGFMDKPGGWYSADGINIETNDSNYAISTNRCLLIRKNRVKSGLNAVSKNTTDFVTLGGVYGEWRGLQIPGTTSGGSGAGVTNACSGFDDIGSFDYGTYYAKYESLDTISLESGIYDSETGTYTISIPELDTLSCTNLKVIVSDGKSTLEQAYKIPIFVQDSITTTHTTFTKEGPDCATCDVVVLNNKTLTVAGTASKNRDVKLYPGAKLLVPTSTSYEINSLALRRDNNTVSTLGYQGTLTLNHLYFDLYIDYKDWYYVALPDTFTLSKLRFANGKNAVHRTDYWVKWYNGKHRAETQSGSWATAPNDTLFQPGAGFIIGLADELIKKELRFEFNAAQTLTNEKNPSGGYKTAGNLRAWGINLDIRPNHKGWNLVGNPYMNIYDTDFAKVIRAGYLEKDMSEGHWNGRWLLSDTTSSKTRYAVIPNKAPQFADAGYYESVALDDKPLLPFTCFFVLMGGVNDNPQSLRFNISKKRNNIVARSYQEEEDDELFLRIKVDDWKTGCFISNQFTDEYEPGDDLESRYPIYLTINEFKLLYSAVNDSIIENGIQVTSPSGTLYLDPKVDVSLFDEINVLYNEQWYSLLYGETVNIESGSFILQAKRKNKDVSTDIENVTPTNGLYKFTDGKCIYINKNGYIYNTLGTKLK